AVADAAQIREDYDLLQAQSESNRWTDETPVPQTVFQPLPVEYPVIATIGVSAKSSFGLEYNWLGHKIQGAIPLGLEQQLREVAAQLKMLRTLGDHIESSLLGVMHIERTRFALVCAEVASHCRVVGCLRL